MKNASSLLIFLIGISSCLFGQDISSPTIVPIEVNVTKDLQKIYIHKLKQYETLYQLSRIFDLPVVYLQKINQIDHNAILATGSEIIIPVKDQIISSQKINDTDVPVIYQVKERETIFRISRIYFDKQIEDIKHLNNLKDLQLDIDQQLQIGWIDLRDPNTLSDTEHIDEPTITLEDEPLTMFDTIGEDKLVNSTNTEQIDTLLHETYEEIVIESEGELKRDSTITSDLAIVNDSITIKVETPDSLVIEPVKPKAPVGKVTYKNGVAYWNKNSTSTELFIMHDEAKINTQIELYNPIVNKRIIATVVARIPQNAYPSDINLVLSPAVAKNLGAFDSRFYVEMKYYK